MSVELYLSYLNSHIDVGKKNEAFDNQSKWFFETPKFIINSFHEQCSNKNKLKKKNFLIISI